MVFNINDTIRDTLNDMGVGVIVDIYTNRHDDPDGITMYVVEFIHEVNDEERIFDRMAHEMELYVEPPIVPTVTVDKAEYDKLVARDKWLSCLEAAGVDSWEGYEEAQEMQDD